MLLLRLELWIDLSGILSGIQFDFRKGKETMDGFSSEKSGSGSIFGHYRGV
jgi:hypothetical protein